MVCNHMQQRLLLTAKRKDGIGEGSDSVMRQNHVLMYPPPPNNQSGGGGGTGDRERRYIFHRVPDPLYVPSPRPETAPPLRPATFN